MAGSIVADSPHATKISYEVSFARHFYKPQPLRPLEEISAGVKTKAKATRMRQYFDPSRAEPEVSPAITQIRGNAKLCVEQVDELLTGEAA